MKASMHVSVMLIVYRLKDVFFLDYKYAQPSILIYVRTRIVDQIIAKLEIDVDAILFRYLRRCFDSNMILQVC